MPPLLDACPVCRSTLRDSGTRCPECGSDLKPFSDALQLQVELAELARQLITSGRLVEAGQLLPRLAQIESTQPELLLELHSKLALAEGNSAGAQGFIHKLSQGPLRANLQAECDKLLATTKAAQELYNAALWHVRSGAFASAANELQRAVETCPGDATLWQLKLKAELKAGLYGRCYASLTALDRLHARPAEFARLEALLPAAVASSIH